MSVAQRLCLTLLLLLFLPELGHTEKVVVIPLSSAGPSVEKKLFLSANLFRTTTSMLAWSWEEDGMMINPNGAGQWIAPILLPTGTTIISLELFWKNNVTNTGVSAANLHIFNLLGQVTMSS